MRFYITRLIDVDRHCFRACGRHLLPSTATFYTADFARKKMYNFFILRLFINKYCFIF